MSRRRTARHAVWPRGRPSGALASTDRRINALHVRVFEKPLVGRSSELRTAERALHRVSGGGSAVLEVRGEPGIGKSRLLSELAARARARRFQVLTGRAAELLLDLPFAAVADALSGALSDSSDALRAVLVQRAGE